MTAALPPKTAAFLTALDGGRGAEPTEADLTAELWTARPILAHLHTYARARGVAPLAVLACTLARLVATVPADVVLPPLVGGHGTLNVFTALVGQSGAGKGAAHATSVEAVDLADWRDPVSGDELHTTGVGSGEGVLHQYVKRDRDGGLTRIRESVLLVIPEVDTLTALGARQGATLLPKLREVYSGEELSFGYVDPTKRLTVRAHSYRATLILGVQPLRAAPLLDDADGGTPQRFLWVPVADQHMPHPRERPEAPTPVTVALPSRPHGGRLVLPVADVLAEEVTEAHWRRSRGEVSEALDGHRLYTREKVAAGLALLDGRLTRGVTAEDWHLTGVLMALSDRTREDVRAKLADRTREVNAARAKAEGDRDVVKADRVETVETQRAGRAVTAVLDKRPGEWLTTKQLRAALPGRVKRWLPDALNALTLAGSVEVEPVPGTAQSGHRYRSRS
jgi:hypothetical protein